MAQTGGDGEDGQSLYLIVAEAPLCCARSVPILACGKYELPLDVSSVVFSRPLDSDDPSDTRKVSFSPRFSCLFCRSLRILSTYSA